MLTGGFNPFGSWDEFASIANRQGFAWKNLIGQDKVESWTPRISFGGLETGVTYTVQRGSFYRVGRLVFLSFRVILSSTGGLSGSAELVGLPIAVADTSAAGDAPFPIGFWSSMTTSFIQLAVWPQPGTTQATFYGSTEAATEITARTAADFSNTSFIVGYLFYPV